MIRQTRGPSVTPWHYISDLTSPQDLAAPLPPVHHCLYWEPIPFWQCTANLYDITDNLGVSDPNHEQQLDLFSDLEHVEGYNPDDIV